MQSHTSHAVTYAVTYAVTQSHSHIRSHIPSHIHSHICSLIPFAQADTPLYNTIHCSLHAPHASQVKSFHCTFLITNHCKTYQHYYDSTHTTHLLTFAFYADWTIYWATKSVNLTDACVRACVRTIVFTSCFITSRVARLFGSQENWQVFCQKVEHLT